MTYYRAEKPTLLDETGTTSANMLAKFLQQTEGGPPGYRLRRIVLTNFWLYEYQIIEIPHGRLFLAGDNGSGKSTVLTAAITLALDGDYRPERIDTFGKREKKIDYYIIGGNESNTPFSRDQRTGYICLEFEWCDMQAPPFASELRTLWEKGNVEQARFLTIGLGFAGNKNNVNPITPLRFLITDGTRLGENNLSTFVETSGENPRACDLKAFKKLVSTHGIICDNLQDYQRNVAHSLFNFSKTEDLTRLTRQLLYLRQPNLNSVLSLEKVRVYLDESLPELPISLIERAAEMLELMGDLQAATEKRKIAYNATEKVHRSQQIVAMAQARSSACECLYVLAQLEITRKEVQRLERNIRRIERDLERYKERVQTLETEELELTGKISALENSEGLQLAQRLSQAQTQVKECNEKLVMSQDALTSATGRREQTEDTIEMFSETFQQRHTETMQLLQGMQASAEQEVHWSIAADQLLNTLERVGIFSLDASLLDIPERLSSLSENALTEQMKWLERLKTLHHELERVRNSLHEAHQQEQKAYNTLDERTRQFESLRRDVCVAQQDLVDQLELLLESTAWASLIPSAELAELTWNAALLPSENVLALAKIQQSYTDAIKRVGEEISRVQRTRERELGELHKQQGVKEEEINTIRKAYSQKQQEPEFTPVRSFHRQKAREYLAAQGIAALPFYMLVDFTEEIDSQSPLAGGIEQALENAGLLDALVVLPENIEAMDACCLTHGLNDCRLDLIHLSNEPRGNTMSLSLAYALRVDPALSESVNERSTGWIDTARVLLEYMQCAVPQQKEEHRERWTHGLLTGSVGVGMAHCIGKATRVYAQKQELERLRRQQELCEQELVTIIAEIENIERQRRDLETLRKTIEALMAESQLSELSATLQAALVNLNLAQKQYNQVQEASRALVQKSNTLQGSLQKESDRTFIFATNSEKVEKAYEAVNRLRSDHRTLIIYLKNVRETWQGYKRAQRQLVQNTIEERNATLTKQRDENTLTRIKAELAALERLAQEVDASNIKTMIQQLTTWKARQRTLPEDLKTARTDETRSQGALENYQKGYAEALTIQSQAEKRSTLISQQFRLLLTSYPVELLADVQTQMAESSVSSELLQQVLGRTLEPGENAYTLFKNELEKNEAKTRNGLSQSFIEVNSLLHEYGPHYDEAGVVRFTNAEEANAYELLSRLGEEIRQHELLLEEKEYELFQNFLLKEMANTVGTRLTEAEVWIQRMNSILANSTFIKERYRLRWVARPHDATRPGSHLAQYRDVLRRQAETFNEEVIDALIHAFRQEISSLRILQSTSGSTATFAEALMSILDYRRWFQFEIDVLHDEGAPQHLTNKFFRRGSGAEQYIALYIPFFAALSALYESAGKGAPRLIALDEAFDKVSTANTRKLLNFLAEQNFQWIMSGPSVTGEGTTLPACVKYTMFCNKKDELAVGFPSFWSSNPAVAKEVQADR
ncbi:MAG: hypothetical protein H0V70_19215 [Ktedonobacteraceae bacterium]|nr:hypothetical protein [Ktedonobacteraceae bacterium]